MTTALDLGFGANPSDEGLSLGPQASAAGDQPISHVGRQLAVGEGRNQATGCQILSNKGARRQRQAPPAGGVFDREGGLVEPGTGLGVDTVQATRFRPGGPIRSGLLQRASRDMDERVVRQINGPTER